MRGKQANSSGESGFNRRDFLRGSSAAAAAGVLGTSTGLLGSQSQGAEVHKGLTEVSLDVNGTAHSVEVEPRTTLLDALRYQLELTGAKPISSDGSSGGSTVLLNGKPVSASTKLALQCVGKKITTIEAGGANDKISKAFVEADAQQCGFCTPGFIMAVRSFLHKNPHASQEEIRQGLNGNICRCGTYANIVQAAMAVVKGDANG